MLQSKISYLIKILKGSTYDLLGFQKSDKAKVLFTFLALFSLMVSYYLVKPLREALYFREFGADFLPIFHLTVIVASILLTQAFHQLLGRVEKTKVLHITYPSIAFVHLSFLVFLVNPSKVIVMAFCLWSSVYFLLCLALLWGITNQRFSSDSGRKSYSFIWLGAILGAVIGSKVSIFLSKQGIYAPNLLFSAMILILAYWFLHMACPTGLPVVSGPVESDNSSSKGVMKDLFRNPYLLGVTVLILSLTFCRSVFDYTTNGMVERELSRKVLQGQFNPEIDHAKSENIDSLLEIVLKVKREGVQSRNKFLNDALGDLPKPWKSNPMEGFKGFQDSLQQKTAIFFGEVYFYQNCLGVLLLIILKGGLIRFLGLPLVLMVLPILYLISSFTLIFNTDINLVQFLKVLTGAVDYSWNNTGKELLYIPLDFEANLRFKPMIEGPIFRLGGAIAAFSKMGLDQIFQAAKASNCLLLISILLILAWMKSARFIGRRCEELTGCEVVHN